MGKFNKGSEAIRASAESANGGGGYTQFLSWGQEKKNCHKFVQFITPLEDIPVVLLHQFVIVKYRDDGSPVYENFVSRRDTAFDGANGYDPIADRFGLQARPRCVAVAVELEPSYAAVKPYPPGEKPLPTPKQQKKITSFSPMMREWKDKEGTAHSEPMVGLVVQAASNFFGWLTTYEETSGEDITQTIFSITRRGKGKDTTYDFVPLQSHDVVDTSEFKGVPDLEGFLNKHADEERLRSLIDGLPDDFKITNYPPKDSDRPKRTRRNDEPDPEDHVRSGNGVVAAAFTSNEEKSRFDRFKEQFDDSDPED